MRQPAGGWCALPLRPCPGLPMNRSLNTFPQPPFWDGSDAIFNRTAAEERWRATLRVRGEERMATRAARATVGPSRPSVA